MLENQIITVNNNFRLERFENEILLYSAADTTAFHLNETAHVIYEMCNNGKEVGEIVAILEEAYPFQSKTIRQDVFSTLQQLVDDNVLLLNE